MGIKVIWENEEKTIIRYIYEGQWDIDEFYESIKQSNAMMDEADYPVDVILDMRNSKLLPRGFMSPIRSIDTHVHPNLGNMVLVGAGAFVKSFINLFSKLHEGKKKRMLLADNLEEARATLACRQADLG